MSKVKEIWKYDLPLTDRSVIRMPKGAKVLTVQIQDGSAKLWVLADPHGKAQEDRIFHVIGTGQQFSAHGIKYINTVQVGFYVWHIFDGGCE